MLRELVVSRHVARVSSTKSCFPHASMRPMRPRPSHESRSKLRCNTATKHPFCCLQRRRRCHFKQMLVSWQTEKAILFVSRCKRHREILLHLLSCFQRWEEESERERDKKKMTHWVHRGSRDNTGESSTATHKDTSFLSFSKKKRRQEKWLN